MNQKLLKPVEWVRHIRGVSFSQREWSARSWYGPCLSGNWIGAITRQRIVEIVLNGCIELELALINQLHHRVCKHCLGEGRTIHNGVRGARISLGVTDAVGVDVTDLAVIDDRNGHALGVGVRHDLADFGVDWHAAGYGLSDGPTGMQKEAKSGAKRGRTFFRILKGSPFRTTC